jgi:hypothetical protein
MKQEKALVHFDAPVRLNADRQCRSGGAKIGDWVIIPVLYMVKRRVKAINIGCFAA